MFENIGNFFKKMMKTEQKELLVDTTSKDAAKERLHIVLMQDRANVSADFLELMKQEIIDVIKKYIVIDEEQIDVRLTNQENEDGTTGAPSLYANIPILNIRNDIKSEVLNQNATNILKTDDLKNIDFNDKTVIIPIIEENINNKEIENDIVEDRKEEIANSENDLKEDIENKVESSIENDKIEGPKKSIEEQIDDLDIKEADLIDEKDINQEELYEEDDDDVTFDDLLKAAEEEERKEAEEKAKLENEEKEEKKTTSKTTTKKKTTKKGKKSTSKKKK